jgi:hypothetical protein
MTLKGHVGKYKDIGGAAGILEIAGMTDAACVLRPVSVGAGAGIEGDGRDEDEDVAPGVAGESAVGERGLDSAGGV